MERANEQGGKDETGFSVRQCVDWLGGVHEGTPVAIRVFAEGRPLSSGCHVGRALHSRGVRHPPEEGQTTSSGCFGTNNSSVGASSGAGASISSPRPHRGAGENGRATPGEAARIGRDLRVTTDPLEKEHDNKEGRRRGK